MSLKTGILSVLGASVFLAQPAAAVEFTGGEVSLGYSMFTAENDLSRFTLDGAVELGFNQSFGAQIDLSHSKFGFTDLSTTSATLHAIYHVNDTSSLGVFYTYEKAGINGLGSGNLDVFGIEGGFERGAWDVEGYVGFGKEQGVSFTTFGADIAYQLSDRFKVGVSHDRVELEDVISFHSTALRGRYEVATGMDVYADLGKAGVGVDLGSVSVSADETFVGFGLTYTFGADRGATFGKRNLSQIVPGL